MVDHVTAVSARRRNRYAARPYLRVAISAGRHICGSPPPPLRSSSHQDTVRRSRRLPRPHLGENAEKINMAGQARRRDVRDVIVLPPNKAALACAFAISVMFAGTAWSEASQVANTDYGCSYSSKAKGDVLHFEHCAWSDAAGHFHLKRKHRLVLDFDRHGLASVNIGGGWYYVRRDGRLAPVMAMDNWAEPFADGLARSPVGGKIGFIDRNLALVISARYDGAFPFEH